MQYDPIKRSLGFLFNKHPRLRILFYYLLDLLLLRSWHIRKELRSFARQNRENIAVLDAGSGFGQYDWFMSRFSPRWNILGVDLKEEQIADCNEFFSKMKLQPGIRFETADLTTLIHPETYNLVLTVDVMEHITEDLTVFRNFYASMKKGGMLLISTPSDQGGSDAHDEHDESFVDEHVRNGYNISEIRNKLYEAGFSKVDARFSYGWPGKISWKLSMKYPVIMLNTSRIFFILLPFYYLITFPFSLLLNALDLALNHPTGTGLIVKAWKE